MILSHKLRCYTRISGPEKSRNNTIFFHVCWYSQSAAYMSLAFGATGKKVSFKTSETSPNQSCVPMWKKTEQNKTKQKHTWNKLRKTTLTNATLHVKENQEETIDLVVIHQICKFGPNRGSLISKHVHKISVDETASNEKLSAHQRKF